MKVRRVRVESPCAGAATDPRSQYIRELLYTTLLQDKTNVRSKVIEVKNRGYVRTVVLALFCGACSAPAESQTTTESSSSPLPPSGWPAVEAKVRISRRTDQLQCLCDKVLSFPLSEFREEELEQLEQRALLTGAAGDDELKRRLERCRLTPGQLRMWGFPLPQLRTEPDALATLSGDEGSERPAKRAKIADEEDDGGVLDDETAEAMLRLLRDRFFVDAAMRPSTGADLYRPPRGFVDTLSPASLAAMAAQLGTTFAPALPAASLDCEMLDVFDGAGGVRREVVRVSLLDARQRSVFEAVVCPAGAAPRCADGRRDVDLTCVADFKERYTGIGRDALRTRILAGQTISQAQLLATLLTRVSRDTLLVGHGLENDLRCLGLAHGRVVDTAVLYRHPRGFPFRLSLQQLARRHLGRAIQRDGSAHCSAEDAATAWQLAVLLANQRASGIVADGAAAAEERVSLLRRLQTQLAAGDGAAKLPVWLCGVGLEATPTADEAALADSDGSDEAADETADEQQDAAEASRGMFERLRQQYERGPDDAAATDGDDAVTFAQMSSVDDAATALRSFVDRAAEAASGGMRVAVLHVAQATSSADALRRVIARSVDGAADATLVVTLSQADTQEARRLTQQRNGALHGEDTRGALSGVGDTLRRLRCPAWTADREAQFQRTVQRLHVADLSLQVVCGL